MTADLSSTPTDTLIELVETVGRTLNADRCFLYVRQPDQKRGRTAFCWRKNDTIPDAVQPDWKPDTTDLPEEDPLIRAGLALKPSVFVDDIETAGPDVLNRDFEVTQLGHRALIHAHINDGKQLWAILQPAVFGKPRHWTTAEKEWITSLLPGVLPVVQAFSRASDD